MNLNMSKKKKKEDVNTNLTQAQSMPLTSHPSSGNLLSKLDLKDKNIENNNPEAKNSQPQHKESLIPQSALKRRVCEHHELPTGKGIEKTPKVWKYLEEFWKKMTNKKDLKGEIDLKIADLFWYIMWKSDWDPKIMVKDYELFTEYFQTSNGSDLSEDHKQMSKWFSLAWDQHSFGILDWHEFVTGWVLATCGGNETERLGVLFKSIDRDGDTYLRCQDIIDFCSEALDNVSSVDYLMISETVTQIFNDMNRSGPFDAISLEEFIAYAEAHPDGLFATWGKILQYKVVEKSPINGRSALLNEIRQHNKPLRKAEQDERRIKNKINSVKPDNNNTSPNHSDDSEDEEVTTRKRSESFDRQTLNDYRLSPESIKRKKTTFKADVETKRSVSGGSTKISKKSKKKSHLKVSTLSNDSQLFSPMSKTLEHVNEDNNNNQTVENN